MLALPFFMVKQCHRSAMGQAWPRYLLRPRPQSGVSRFYETRRLGFRWLAACSPMSRRLDSCLTHRVSRILQISPRQWDDRLAVDAAGGVADWGLVARR